MFDVIHFLRAIGTWHFYSHIVRCRTIEMLLLFLDKILSCKYFNDRMLKSPRTIFRTDFLGYASYIWS